MMVGRIGTTLFGGALALALGATAVLTADAAYAGQRHHYRYGGGDLLAAGVVGAVIGAAIARPPAPVYYGSPPIYVQPQPVYVYPEPVYSYSQPRYYYDAPPTRRRSLDEYYSAPGAGYPYEAPKVYSYEGTMADAGAAPWTPAWFDYCRRKFRSFDDQSGTYMGFDGKRHFCVIR